MELRGELCSQMEFGNEEKGVSFPATSCRRGRMGRMGLTEEGTAAGEAKNGSGQSPTLQLRCGGYLADWGGYLRGKVTVKIDPWPGWLLTTAVPPWASTKALTRLRPRPRPRRERLLSAR